jgi:hypothetical protein
MVALAKIEPKPIVFVAIYNVEDHALRDARTRSTCHSDNCSISGGIPSSTSLAHPGDNFRHGSEKIFLSGRMSVAPDSRANGVRARRSRARSLLETRHERIAGT